MDKTTENELNQFVEEIILEKSLQLPSSNYSFNSLVDNEILKVVNNKYIISDYSIIADFIFEKYKEKFDFSLKKDFIENVNFIQKIIQEFKQDKFETRLLYLEKELWKTIIIKSNKIYDCDFKDFITSLDKQKESYIFIEAYSSSLKELDLKPKTFIDNANRILEFLKNDGVQSYVYNGISEKCDNDFEFGIKLFEISLQESENDKLLAAIISGLYKKKRKIFYNNYLSHYVKQNKHIKGILFGLSNINEIKNEDYNLFIKLFDRFKKTPKTNIPRNALLLALLKHSKSNQKLPDLTKNVFNRLIEEIKIEETATYILHNLAFIDKFPKEKINLLKEFIKQPFFDFKKNINIIDGYFYYLRDIKYLKEILITFANYREFESFAKGFHFIHNLNKTELDELIIELLISDKASIRFVGKDIFNELSFNKSYTFSIDILNLSALNQYKLWVSLTQNFIEPKYTLPALLPLLNSKSDLVKESFICKLEIMTEDYGNLIIEILKKHLDLNQKENINIIERIKNYSNKFYNDNISIKRHLKELNPYYIENKYMKLYYNYYNKDMRKAYKKAEENSLLKKIGVPTIKLAKGGGWKLENKGEISKLGTIKHSFSWPRSYFINPNSFDLEQTFLMRKDWGDEDFQIIIDLLKNE